MTFTSDENLEAQIDEVYSWMDSTQPDSDEYEKLAARLKDLYSLREKEETPPTTIASMSPDSVLLAATNLIGIGLVLHHEKLHAISTKALNFVMKLRP